MYRPQLHACIVELGGQGEGVGETRPRSWVVARDQCGERGDCRLAELASCGRSRQLCGPLIERRQYGVLTPVDGRHRRLAQHLQREGHVVTAIGALDEEVQRVAWVPGTSLNHPAHVEELGA